MDTNEILKLMKDVESCFGGLSITKDVDVVIIKRKVTRLAFTMPIFEELIDICTKNHLIFNVRNDQIFVCSIY